MATKPKAKNDQSLPEYSNNEPHPSNSGSKEQKHTDTPIPTTRQRSVSKVCTVVMYTLTDWFTFYHRDHQKMVDNFHHCQLQLHKLVYSCMYYCVMLPLGVT